MVKSDIDMEDLEKRGNDSGKQIQEPEDKLLDGGAERKEENLGDANRNGGGQEGYNELSKEAEDNNSVSSDMTDQIDLRTKVHEPTNAEDSVKKIIDEVPKSENLELSSSKSNVSEETATESAGEGKSDTTNEMIGEDPSNVCMKEEKVTEKGLDGGNAAMHMEDKPIEDFAGKRHDEIGNEDRNQHEFFYNEAPQCPNMEDGMKDVVNANGDTEVDEQLKEQGMEVCPAGVETSAQHADVKNLDNVVEDKGINDELKEHSKEVDVTATETAAKYAGDVAKFPSKQEPITPNSLVKFSHAMAGDRSGETSKTGFTQTTLPLLAESDDGTPEEQSSFMREVESFYHEKAIDFKAPKFYGQPLNCLKLWRSVIRLGGYDRVTGAKLWRQVGESFHPPKTCTTVSWTFRIFYEKSLLEYERHKSLSGELQFPLATPDATGVDSEMIAVGNGYQGSAPGRARRDAAARAMQGWHTQGLLGPGEVGEPIVKDKNLTIMAKREKNIKSIGSMKQKRPNEVEHSAKVARMEASKQLVTSVVDIGQPADWVKINVRQTKDCFEVYALVPGLLREEVRVQSDPAGRLVITGQPEQVDNPWGITPFKKVVSLPSRIDPLQTSAVVSLHGRLFIRVPFEQSNA